MNKLPLKKITFLLLFLCCCFQQVLVASSMEDSVGSAGVDTTYLRTFPNKLMGRAYLSRKYTNLLLEKTSADKKRLFYDPNTSVNLGLGATWRSFTLNLAYGFSFLNQDAKEKGETVYLDLQSHIYKRELVVDLYFQLYKGLYLENTSNFLSLPEGSYYLRPDIKINVFGLSALKVVNSRRFSYAAPFVQNEQQKKSAGSFLYGLKAVAAHISADSNYVPSFVQDSVYRESFDVEQIRSTQAGPAIGYAHSFVYKERLFFTASLQLAFLLGPVAYDAGMEQEEEKWQLNSSATIRVAMGYNSKDWYLGLTLLHDGSQLQTPDEVAQTSVGAGNVRLNYVKRFTLAPKVLSTLDKLPF
jgi:hypothetical protein